MEEALVLYPAPLAGHLFPMIEFCKLILTHHKPSLSIHILITTTPPFNTNAISHYITTISSTIPSITFHSLPAVTLPPATTHHHETELMPDVLRLNTSHVHQALLSISKTHTIQALILHFFCYNALPIASQLNIPSYYFFTCSASNLSFFLHFPTMHSATHKDLRELNTFLDIPGVPPLHTSDTPKPFHQRSHQMYQTVLQSSLLAHKTAGVIINTFEALESRSLKAICDGLCTPNGVTPPVFCLGPLVAKDTQTHVDDECLRWLNLQPRKSVVFLCFGSMGLFSKEQLCEIACGLEKSGQRFLWVVRNPPGLAQEDPDLESLLPQGFLKRTKERGLVVKKWAPQVEVLNSEAVGGFVSHCGWNSVLEAVCAGVPMVGWPLYAEQKFNRVVLVQEMEVALSINECDEYGFVSRVEVEERVRELMESEKGDMVRKRVLAAKDEAKAALSQDGSSRVALTKLLKSWRSCLSCESV